MISAIVLAVVLPLVLNRPKDLGYSYEEENAPLEYPVVETIIFNRQIRNILSVYLAITDKNNHIGNYLLGVLSQARIPAEKLKPFSNYLEEFIDIVTKGGSSPIQGFSGLEYHLMMFFEKTNFTELELGRFLYELFTTITVGSEANKLLLELGQDDFVALSSNTIFTIKMLNKMSEGISARDARALQGIIYSLGVNYLNVLDKLGFENFEKLLGFDYDRQKDDTSMDEEEWQTYSKTMSMVKNKVSNLFYILSQAMTHTSAYGFELLSMYFSIEDKSTYEAEQYLILSHVEIAKAIKKGLDNSFEKAEITGVGETQEFIQSYSELIVQFQIFMDMTHSKESDYGALEEDAYSQLESFISYVELLSFYEKIDFYQIDDDNYQNLLQAAQGLWNMNESMESFVDELLTTLFANFVFNFVSLDDLVENSRKAFQDIIKDTIESIMAVEDYGELNY